MNKASNIRNWEVGVRGLSQSQEMGYEELLFLIDEIDR